MKRRLFQIGSLLISNSYLATFFNKTIHQGWFKGVCVPFMNCYGCPLAMASCPIGTLQHFVIIKAFPLLLVGFLGIIGMTVGRMTCGWLCPFGFFQEMLHKIKTPKLNPPKILKNLKYVSLMITIVIAFLLAEPWFCKLCPIGSLEASIPLTIWNPGGDFFAGEGSIITKLSFLFHIKIAILVLLIVTAIFIAQPFCRYLCPLGATYSIFNRFSLWRMKSSPQDCADCGGCLKNLEKRICPTGVNVYQNPNDMDCIRCLNCTTCPTVKFKFSWKK